MIDDVDADRRLARMYVFCSVMWVASAFAFMTLNPVAMGVLLSINATTWLLWSLTVKTARKQLRRISDDGGN